eukprot:TRINITY_DN67355_c2_g7_i1.p1 TRINITY_DN67355_c2_g7~~TRINITY_DN67355_c2_g7_i1.p1  ORF type:complete len:368 (-),score=48.42 TRINITY_DN67355_c2_g7_i1:237-1340(-)
MRFALLLGAALLVWLCAGNVFHVEFANTYKGKCSTKQKQDACPYASRYPTKYMDGGLWWAEAQPEDGEKFTVQVIRDGRVYVVYDGAYQSVVVIGDTGATVIDAPSELEDDLFDGVREAIRMAGRNQAFPINRFIYSHHHMDHVGGAQQLLSSVNNPNIEIVASAGTNQYLTNDDGTQRHTNRPLATRVISSSTTLDANSAVPIKIDFAGPAHSIGGILVDLPQQQVLIGVDMLNPGVAPFKRLVLSPDVRAYIGLHDTLMSRLTPGYIWLGGHGRPGTQDDVVVSKEYLMDLQRFAGEGAGHWGARFAEIAADIPNNAIARSREFFARAADYCQERIVPLWAGRLDSVDVWAYDNCSTMVEYLALD